MLGSPLPVYIEKDVQDRDNLVNLVIKHGGSVSPGYSGVPYILVDPLKPSGQNLFRQYAGKKGKIVLDARWIKECIAAGRLQSYHTNWAGCKVIGNETEPNDPSSEIITTSQVPDVGQAPRTIDLDQSVRIITQAGPTLHPQVLHPTTVEHMVHAAQTQGHFTYPIYPHAPPPAQNWANPEGIPPQHITPAQASLIPRPSYRDDAWEAYETASNGPTGDPLVAGAQYDYRYRDDQTGWVTSEPFYDYDQPYEQAAGPSGFLEDPEPPAPAPPTVAVTASATTPASQSQSQTQPQPQPQPSQPPPTSPSPTPVSTPTTIPVPVAGPSTEPVRVQEPQERSRGRKRTRTALNLPAAPPSSLVVNRNPPARSPTPPTRVIKSTYGGNLFTADDIEYLKKYIDYCQEQGLVLSLREICERIAIKAPHHTFYSWRRYCNKHQIRLGGYAMNPDRSESPNLEGGENELDEEVGVQAGPGTIEAARARVQADTRPRDRSPTPPRALYRSTTGKGVAFTDEDVAFLIRFMEYRKSQGRLDMVAFWKDVAAKAPHHSRASWMKYWRRHKHELERTDGDDQPAPVRPDKKRRYSREDDVLLAKFFCNQPEGTSDKVFQSFGREHPHHPWKGWQEHHRIHKAKIDHYIKRLKNGENIDIDNGETAS
ncbi:hypothetical protein V5O48_007262 [Marasmius crinis-equi]|uniref:BRCT domain-containing protein n=1 Tax=Marasmius crinis-equi TaxID=585013 RepID=A0ABR3FHS4_9AGAR